MSARPASGRPITARALAAALLLCACTGTLTTPDRGDDGDPAGGSGEGGNGDSGRGTSSDVEIQGPAVREHVQAFANDACAAVGACQPSTYDGHDPSADLALDFLVSDAYGMVPSDDNALGDSLADYALSVQSEAGIRYVIWRQRYNDGSGWDDMEDRGSVTQNHYDHVHISFEESL